MPVDLDIAYSSSRYVNKAPQRMSATTVHTAMDLLQANPPAHLYHHDLEFYAVIWHIHQYQEGRLVQNPPYDEWGRGGLDIICLCR